MNRLIIIVELLLGFCGPASAQFNGCSAGFCAPFVASSGSFSLAYVSNVQSTTTTTTIAYGTGTWGSGCNAAIFAIQWYNTANTDTISSIAVGGNAGTAQVAGVKVGAGNGDVTLDVWQLTSPVGAMGTISVTYSAAPSFYSAVSIYCLVSTTTAATTAVGTFTGVATNINQAITVPPGGAALIVSASQNGHTLTLTNGTIDQQLAVGGLTAFAYGNTTLTGSVTVTSTPTIPDILTLGLVAWGP